MWLPELGFFSATDLDLSLLGAEDLGSVLDGRFGAAWFKDVVTTLAVGLVLVEVVSWVLIKDLGCMVSLELADGLEDLG